MQVSINQNKEEKEKKFLTVLGGVATVTAMTMYLSYIFQLQNNLNGAKGNWLQPLVAGINCSLWFIYGLLKKPKRDLPLIIANVPGILFGLLTFLTAL